jgi:general secretion pathway protein D
VSRQEVLSQITAYFSAIACKLVLTEVSAFGYFRQHSRSRPGKTTLYRDKMSLSPVTPAWSMHDSGIAQHKGMVNEMRQQSLDVGQARSANYQPRKRRVALNHLNEQLRRLARTQLMPLLLGTGMIAPALGDQPSSNPIPSQQTAAAPATDAAAANHAARIAATQSLLARAKAALDAKQYTEAVELYRRARVNAQPLPQFQQQVAGLRQSLTQLGIEPALLDMPPTAPPNGNTPGNGATPVAASPAGQPQPLAIPADAMLLSDTGSPGGKAEALRLVAQGRAALDRGDIATAMRMVTAAETLGVSESEFAAGEPRVWQLALDVQSAARRTGTVAAPTTSASVSDAPADSMVRQASGLQLAGGAAGDGGGVINSVYNSDSDTTKVQPAQALDAPLALSPGDALYRQGLEALSSGNTTRARQLFVEAWKYEANMDLASRAQLKEKLTLLQPTRLPDTTQPGAPADLTPMQLAEMESQVENRRVYNEITSGLATANDMRTSDPLGAMDRMQKLRRRVTDSKLDATASASMLAMVDRAISEQKQYVEANRGQIELDLANAAVRAELANDQIRKQRIDDEIASLVDTFNDLMEQRRYPEAEVVAKKVGELSPGSSIAKSMFHTSRMGVRLATNEEISSAKEDNFAKSLLDIDRASIPWDPARDIDFGDAQQWSELSRRRKTLGESDSRYTAAELEIKRRLSTPVDVHYKARPLSDVIQDLSAVTNIPIVMDSRAMSEMRVTSDAPVTLQLNTPIKLQSALKLILDEFELTYIIENDVLQITSHEARRSRVWPKTYRVTDLVTPIPNFTSGYEDGLAGALRAAYQMTTQQADVHVMPVSMANLASNTGGAGLGRRRRNEHHSSLRAKPQLGHQHDQRRP